MLALDNIFVVDADVNINKRLDTIFKNKEREKATISKNEILF